jgi:hypothetical protein
MIHRSKIIFYLISSMSFGARSYFVGYTQNVSQKIIYSIYTARRNLDKKIY